MTRAGEKLYRDDAPPPSKPWQYVIGALATLSALTVIWPVINWLRSWF